MTAAPWENPPVTWEAAATDDHGGPAWWGQCDGCDTWAWLLNDYSEASGPCELDPDYADRMQQELADPHSKMIPGGAALRGHAGPLCGNCAAVIAFCSACMPVLFRPGGRGTAPEGPPRMVDENRTQPPWAQDGGEGR
jgi:hypothetical protein